LVGGVYVGERKELEESGEWRVASGEPEEKKDFTTESTLRVRSGRAEGGV